MCADLAHGADYLFAGVVPQLPARPGIFEFFFGGPESGPAVIPINMAQGRMAWTTGPRPQRGGPWTHADLACGIGGFSVAADRLGGKTVWACDMDPTVAWAFTRAFGSAHGVTAQAAPIEDRARWGQHAGVDLVTAGFPCQPFSSVGQRRGFNDLRGQVIFSLVQVCWALRPAFMVLECVWPFFREPCWLDPVVEQFQAMAYGVFVRREDASAYIPQDRLRGTLVAVRQDFWGRATGDLLGFFTGPPPP